VRRALSAGGQVIALIVVFALFSVLARNFRTIRNALTLALQTSTFALVGIGAIAALAGTQGGVGAQKGLTYFSPPPHALHIHRP